MGSQHLRQHAPGGTAPFLHEDNIFAMQLLKPDERALFYPCGFDFNFSNKLLPGARHAFYLPWQAEFLRAGGLDLCDEIAQKQPVLIYKNKAFSINTHPWLQYAANVDAYVEKNYLPLGDGWFILPETAAANRELLSEYGHFPNLRARQFAPGKPSIPLGNIEQSNPVRATLPKPTEPSPPRVIKIRLGTYRRLPADLSGHLSVTVRDEQQATIGSKIIPLQRIQDNDWLAIDLSGKAHPATLDIACSATAAHSITIWTIDAPEYANMTSGPETPNGFLIEHILLY